MKRMKTLKPSFVAATFGGAVPPALAGDYCYLHLPGFGCGDTSGMTDATGSGWVGPAPQLTPGNVLPYQSNSSLAQAVREGFAGQLPVYQVGYSGYPYTPSGWTLVDTLGQPPGNPFCTSGYVPYLLWNGSSYLWEESTYYYGCSCFPAGALVMMADGAQRAIETIRVGEWLMGADGHPVQVRSVDRPRLGDRRMMAFADGSQIWSEEHGFWTRDAAGAEWWWSANPDQWRYEASIGHIGGLRDNASMRAGDGFEFAQLRGWVRQEVIEAEGYGPETQLYLPRTDGVPIIVNGYVVGAGVNQEGFEYADFRWAPDAVAEAIARQALARVIRGLPTVAARLPAATAMA